MRMPHLVEPSYGQCERDRPLTIRALSWHFRDSTQLTEIICGQRAALLKASDPRHPTRSLFCAPQMFRYQPIAGATERRRSKRQVAFPGR